MMYWIMAGLRDVDRGPAGGGAPTFTIVSTSATSHP